MNALTWILVVLEIGKDIVAAFEFLLLDVLSDGEYRLVVPLLAVGIRADPDAGWGGVAWREVEWGGM